MLDMQPAAKVKAAYCQYLVLAPTPVVDRVRASHPDMKITPGEGPLTGYAMVVLTLDPRVIEGWANRALLVSEVKAPPKPTSSTVNEGRILQALRLRVSSWLKALELPKVQQPWESIKRLEEYMRVAGVATGSDDGWGLPRAFSNGDPLGCTSPREALERIKRDVEHKPTPGELSEGAYKARPGRKGVSQQHKKHQPRRDIYWVLTTCRGHTLYIRSGSAMSRRLDQGDPPSLPDGWTLVRTVAVSEGKVTRAVSERFRAIARDYEGDFQYPQPQKLRVMAIREFFSAVEKAAAAGRALARLRASGGQRLTRSEPQRPAMAS